MWKDHRLNISVFQSKLDKYFNFPINLVDFMWIPDLVFDNTKNGMVFHLAQPNRVIRLQSDGTFRRSSRCVSKFLLFFIFIQTSSNTSNTWLIHKLSREPVYSSLILIQEKKGETDIDAYNLKRKISRNVIAK